MGNYVLVVDDEEAIGIVLSEALKCAKLTVKHVKTLSEARKALNSTPPDLIILDILFPNASGLTFLKQLRKQHPHLPVIVFTGIGYDKKLMTSALKSGASAYLAKGIKLEQLLTIVRKLLNEHASDAKE